MKKLSLLLLLLMLTACGTLSTVLGPDELLIYDENEENDMYAGFAPIQVPATTSQLPESDGTLRLSMRHPITLNPLLNEDVTVAKILRLIFEPLVVLDENFRATSHLAEIELASDFTGAVVTIRSDAFWADGMPVTSDDLIFSVATLRNAPTNAIYRRNAENIADITRIDMRSVQINFHQASIDAGICLNFPIIPQHHYSGQTNPRSHANMNPLGNAPFMMELHTPMRSITLMQNPYSFRNRPQIEEIEVIFLPDAQTELYAFDQGRIHALNLSLTEWARHLSVRHIRHEIVNAMYFVFIGFNFEREIFHDIQIRRGIAHAFNIDEVVSAVYLTHAVRAASPIHPYNWAASNVAGIEHNPFRAFAILSAIELYEPITILANADNPQRVSIANRLAAALHTAGLPATAVIVPYDEYFARLESGDFDLFIGGVNLPFMLDFGFLFGGGFFIYDHVLDSALSAIPGAITEPAHRQAVANFQQAFVDHIPVIGLAFRHSAVLTNMHISQNQAPPPCNIFGVVNLWSLPRHP